MATVKSESPLPGGFAESTHNKHWMFPNLKDLRQHQLDQFEKHLQNVPKDIATPLSIEEVETILMYYEKKLIEVCGVIGFPDKPKATALVYFKRFFLNRDIVSYLPDTVMLTCIYIAAKADESHIDASDLAKRVDRDPTLILQNELSVLEGLKFHLNVYHPYRSLHGFTISFTGKIDQTVLNNLWSKSNDLINKAIVTTEVYFILTPAQIALAAIAIVSKKEHIEEEFISNFIKDLVKENLTKFNENVKTLEESLSKEETFVDENKVKEYEYKASLLRKNTH